MTATLPAACAANAQDRQQDASPQTSGFRNLGLSLNLADEIFKAVGEDDFAELRRLQAFIQVHMAPLYFEGEERWTSNTGRVVTRYWGGGHGSAWAPDYLTDMKSAMRLVRECEDRAFTIYLEHSPGGRFSASAYHPFCGMRQFQGPEKHAPALLVAAFFSGLSAAFEQVRDV